MISYIKGKLEIKNIDNVIIEVGGIGYKIYMSAVSMDKLGEIGSDVKIYTLGAKSALSILANITPSSFALAIITGDITKLKTLPGIGAKSAQRMVLELKDKLKTQEAIETEVVPMQTNAKNDKAKDAIDALQVLGYAKKDIEHVISKVDTEALSVEEIIKQGLKYLGM